MVRGKQLDKLNKCKPDQWVTVPSKKSRCAKRSDLPSCCECGEAIDEDVKALQCEKCVADTWKCASCLGLSDELYDELVASEKHGLHWFCTKCEESVLTTFPVMSDRLVTAVDKLSAKTDSIEQYLMQNITNLEQKLMDKITEVEEMFRGKASTEIAQVVEEKLKKLEDRPSKFLEEKTTVMDEKLERLMKDLDSCSAERIQHTLQEDLAEVEETRCRKTNIIIHGLQEPTSDDQDEHEQDENNVEHLLHELKCDDVSVTSIVRLGRRPVDEDSKPQPLKVVLASEDQKDKVLRVSKNLKYKGDGLEKVFMHQDLTPKQRQKGRS